MLADTAVIVSCDLTRCEAAPTAAAAAVTGVVELVLELLDIAGIEHRQLQQQCTEQSTTGESRAPEREEEAE